MKNSAKLESNAADRLIAILKKADTINISHDSHISGIKIEPGSTHYIPVGHPSGFGGQTIYIPRNGKLHLQQLQASRTLQRSCPGEAETASSFCQSCLFLDECRRLQQKRRQGILPVRTSFCRSLSFLSFLPVIGRLFKVKQGE